MTSFEGSVVGIITRTELATTPENVESKQGSCDDVDPVVSRDLDAMALTSQSGPPSDIWPRDYSAEPSVPAQVSAGVVCAGCLLGLLMYYIQLPQHQGASAPAA